MHENKVYNKHAEGGKCEAKVSESPRKENRNSGAKKSNSPSPIKMSLIERRKMTKIKLII